MAQTSQPRALALPLVGVLLVGIASVVGLAGAADATEHDGDDARTNRIGGEQRFETARLIAETRDPEDVDEVLVATGMTYPDALAAGYLAGQIDGPVLLSADDHVVDDLEQAIETLEPERITLLGGTQAIGETVEEALADHADVRRLSGADRFKTASEVAVAEPGVGLWEDEPTALLATGEDFPDALAAGTVAAHQAFPLLLTESEQLGQEAEQALEDLGIQRVLIVGGQSAVSRDIRSELEDEDYTVRRVNGSERTGTSVELAKLAEKEFGFTFEATGLARGDVFADALAAAPYLADRDSPVVLTATSEPPHGASQLGKQTNGFLSSNCSAIELVTVFGGIAAVSSEAEEVAGRAADC